MLDTADGLYFVVNNGNSATQISKARFRTRSPATALLFSLYNDPAIPAADKSPEFRSNHQSPDLFRRQRKYRRIQCDLGIERLDYSPIALTGNANLTPTVLGTVYSQIATGSHGGVSGLAMDFTDPNSAEAVFAVNSGGDRQLYDRYPGHTVALCRQKPDANGNHGHDHSIAAQHTGAGWLFHRRRRSCRRPGDRR